MQLSVDVVYSAVCNLTFYWKAKVYRCKSKNVKLNLCPEKDFFFFSPTLNHRWILSPVLACLQSLRVSSISTSLLSCPGIFSEEAASLRHVTPCPPMAQRQSNFCDKGIAVKSERIDGVSLWDPQWSPTHTSWPFWLWQQPYRQWPTVRICTDWSFLLYSPQQPMQGCINTYIQVLTVWQSSVTGDGPLYKCWETRLKVGVFTALQSVVCIHSWHVNHTLMMFKSRNQFKSSEFR